MNRGHPTLRSPWQRRLITRVRALFDEPGSWLGSSWTGPSAFFTDLPTHTRALPRTPAPVRRVLFDVSPGNGSSYDPLARRLLARCPGRRATCAARYEALLDYAMS